MVDVPKINELRLIRCALDKTQAEMGALLGDAPQTTYQWWEKNPEKAESMEALEKAKAVYREVMGSNWFTLAPQPPELVSARVQWLVDGLNRALLLIEDLDRRVQQAENKNGAPG